MYFLRLLSVMAFLAEVSARTQLVADTEQVTAADSLLHTIHFDSAAGNSVHPEGGLHSNAISSFDAKSSYEAPGEDRPEGIKIDKDFHLTAGDADYVNVFEVESLDNPDLADDNPETTPPAVCPDLPLTRAGSRANTFAGRMYFSLKSGGRSACTAWFVTPTKAVTAGHCVSNGDGMYHIDWSKQPIVCLQTQSDRGCDPRYTYDIVYIQTTVGWFNDRRFINDGAVITVKPRRGDTVATSPRRYDRFFRPDICGLERVYWTGYPGRSSIAGCGLNWDEWRHYTNHMEDMDNCDAYMSGSIQPEFDGGGCGGMSGGPFYDFTRGAWTGIISNGWTFCSQGKTKLRLTPITFEGDGMGGINLHRFL